MSESQVQDQAVSQVTATTDAVNVVTKSDARIVVAGEAFKLTAQAFAPFAASLLDTAKSVDSWSEIPVVMGTNDAERAAFALTMLESMHEGKRAVDAVGKEIERKKASAMAAYTVALMGYGSLYGKSAMFEDDKAMFAYVGAKTGYASNSVAKAAASWRKVSILELEDNKALIPPASEKLTGASVYQRVFVRLQQKGVDTYAALEKADSGWLPSDLALLIRAMENGATTTNKATGDIVILSGTRYSDQTAFASLIQVIAAANGIVKEVKPGKSKNQPAQPPAASDGDKEHAKTMTNNTPEEAEKIEEQSAASFFKVYAEKPADASLFVGPNADKHSAEGALNGAAYGIGLYVSQYRAMAETRATLTAFFAHLPIWDMLESEAKSVDTKGISENATPLAIYRQAHKK